MNAGVNVDIPPHNIALDSFISEWIPGLEINFLVYWSIVQCIQIFTWQNASCTGQVQEQLK